MADVLPSVMRTVVPLISGAVVTGAAWIGLDLEGEKTAIAVTTAVTALYYAILRLLEERAHMLGISWLKTLTGGLLGGFRPPRYQTPSIDLNQQMGAS